MVWPHAADLQAASHIAVGPRPRERSTSYGNEMVASRPPTAPSNHSACRLPAVGTSVPRSLVRSNVISSNLIPVSQAWAIDAHASIAYLPSLRGWVETYTGGVSYER